MARRGGKMTSKGIRGQQAKRPGRPVTHAEPWTKATVVLFNRQIAYLDRLAADARAKTGAAVTRAELIRGMIDAVEVSGLDLTAITSEQDVRTILAERLRRR